MATQDGAFERLVGERLAQVREQRRVVRRGPGIRDVPVLLPLGLRRLGRFLATRA